LDQQVFQNFLTEKIIPKKRFSQNFLTNENAAQRMVETLDLKEYETVLEIGPGKGILTKYLIQRSNNVVGVEIDRRLCSFLEKKFSAYKNFTLINKDFLKVNLNQFSSTENKMKVIGSLPYQITSPILSVLMDNKQLIELAVLMVQKEVAQRICAQPNSKDWSPLSIGVQLFSDVKILFKLKPASFNPAPQVGSTVTKISFLKKLKVEIKDENLFFKLVKASFAQRRKTILNSLSSNYNIDKTRLGLALGKAKIDPKRRAESLSIEEFSVLAETVSQLENE
jgi:16S rRNA (adenine1518-N6/adenine1519-N6)-dimethyltransferase